MTIDLNKLQALAEAAKLEPTFELQTLWDTLSPDVVMEVIAQARKTEKHWECEFVARGKKLTEVEREVESLRAENERLREVLKEIANDYQSGVFVGEKSENTHPEQLARKALEDKNA